MEYFTKFKLSVRNVRSEERFNELVQTLKDKEIISYALCEGTYYSNSKEALFEPFEETRWYEHTDHMISIAEKFPEMYFELEGHGEEDGDFWRMYFHDMDIETCLGEVVFEQPRSIDWNALLVF